MKINVSQAITFIEKNSPTEDRDEIVEFKKFSKRYCKGYGSGKE